MCLFAKVAWRNWCTNLILVLFNNITERAFETTHPELLAEVWAVWLFWPSLEGFRFAVWTFQESLKTIVNVSDLTGKLGRWRLQFLGCEFDVIPSPWIKHQAADALLPLTTTGTNQTTIDDVIQELCITAFIHSKRRVECYGYPRLQHVKQQKRCQAICSIWP